MKDLPEVVGVSAASVKNACRKFDIPVPDRGHWAKLRAGKSSKPRKLPDRAPGMSNEVVFGAHHYGYGSTVDMDAPLPPDPTFETSIEAVREAVAKKIGKVTMPRGKHAWHHVIQRLFAADDKRRAKIAESRWAYSWDKPLFDNSFELRRLKILHAVFMGIAKCGGKPSIQGKDAIEISITVNQQHVPLKLLATSDLKRNNNYRDPDNPHSVKEPLSLIVPNYMRSNDVRMSWADTSDTKLETHLTEIAIELVVLAEVFYRESKQRSHEWLIERKTDHERRKAEAEAAHLEALRIQKEKFEIAKRDMLLGHARDLDYARTLRRLVDDVLEHKGDVVEEETAAWAEFVRTEAEKIDPINGNRFLDVMHLKLEDFADSSD